MAERFRIFDSFWPFLQKLGAFLPRTSGHDEDNGDAVKRGDKVPSSNVPRQSRRRRCRLCRHRWRRRHRRCRRVPPSSLLSSSSPSLWVVVVVAVVDVSLRIKSNHHCVKQAHDDTPKTFSLSDCKSIAAET